MLLFFEPLLVLVQQRQVVLLSQVVCIRFFIALPHFCDDGLEIGK